MKIKIEIDERLEDEEVVIKTPCMNEKIQHIQEVLRDISKSQTAIVFYKGTVGYFIYCLSYFINYFTVRYF